MGRVFGFQVVQLHPGGSVAAFVAVNDPGGAVEAILEDVAHGSEGGQAHPAGSHGAGARHAVAFALLAHL